MTLLSPSTSSTPATTDSGRLQKFIFSREYNIPERKMLSRFLSGGMHPMIHVGYAAEMELPVMLVEGKYTTLPTFGNNLFLIS